MTIEQKKTYTDSAISDLFRDFFNSYKNNNSYKYVDLIDAIIVSNSPFEIDHDDLTEELQDIIKNNEPNRIHNAVYRAIVDVLRTRLGSSVNGLKEENLIKFTITNYDNFKDKIFERPDIEIIDKNEIVELDSLIQIENPEYVGSLIKVKAVIASNTISYNVPDKVEYNCRIDNAKHNCVGKKTYKVPLESKAGFIEVNEVTRHKREEWLSQVIFTDKCKVSIEETQTSTIKKLRIKPIINSITEDENGKLVDQEGNEYKHYDIYLEQNKVQSLEAGKEVEIVGKIIPDPKSQKVSLVATEVNKLEDENYSIENIKKLREFYHTKSVREIVSWFTDEFQKYSKVIKRHNVTTAGLLTFFSPLVFEFEAKRYSGWVKTVVIGDSTTGKTETIKRLIILFDAGQVMSAETATIIGLTGATTQASNNQWFVEWGALPLNDRRLLAIDGAHKLSKEHWDTIAETERDGIINIQKAGKAKTTARTRQIKIMNPVSDDFRTTKAMKNFYYPVQAIINTLQIQSIARQDLSIFVSDDVPSSDRNVRNGHDYDKMLENYSDLLKLVWLQKYDIAFDDDAINAIMEKATELENKFKDEDIPLITNDQKIKLARLGVSIANFCCSFNHDFSELRVTREHVEFVSNFIKTEYENSGLDKISRLNADVEINENVMGDMVYDIKKILDGHIPEFTDDDVLKMFEWMASKAKFIKDDLMTKYGFSEKLECRKVISYLRTESLLNSRNGFVPTKKLISIGKFIADCKNNNKSPLGIKEDDVSIKSFKCKNCFTEFKNTTESLQKIQDKHQKSNPSHIIEEI